MSNDASMQRTNVMKMCLSKYCVHTSSKYRNDKPLINSQSISNNTVVMKLTNLLINVLVFSSSVIIISMEPPPLYKLYTHLFSTYRTDTRPVKNYSTTVLVYVSFMLSSVDGLDGAKQTFRAAGWFDISWTDEMLTWDRNQYAGISRIDVPADRIWKPDIAIRNDANTFAMLSKYDGHCVITADGYVIWYVAIRRELTCAVHVEKYPFDTQTCSVNVVQWATDISEINMTVVGQSLSPVLFSSIHEWEVTGQSTNRIVFIYCGMNQVFLQFKYSLKRKPYSFLILAALPLILLSMLKLFVFFLPTESGEKISFSVSVTVAYAVLMTMATNELPKTPDTVSIFGLYTDILFFTNVMAIIFSVIVIRLYYKNPYVPISPRWKPILAIFRLLPDHPDRVSERHECLSEIPKPPPERHEMALCNNSRRRSQEKPEDQECYVWKHLSRKVDRVFFWVTTVATLGAMVVSFLMLLL